jgi:tetratricopeptide (TPR) repeat protein
VFWVHASNAARIEQGYRDIADQVKLAGRKDPQADVFKLVHDWLRNEQNGKWLLVLDNANDTAALSLPVSYGQKTQASGGDNAPPRYFSSYLPQSKNGSVLVTSRTRSVARQLAEENDIIPIEPMDEAGAQALLQKKLGEEVNRDSTAELAEALEFMPLALVQAAAYIRQRALRCSVQQYLEMFHKSDRKRMDLLDNDGGLLRRDEKAKNSILITWQISFNYIHYARRSAADLLSLMSFFDRQGIPETLIRNQGGTGNRHKGEEAINTDGENSDSDNSMLEASVNDGFEEDVLTLRDYSFITLTTDATTFDMHRLVQLATRKWLEEQGQLEMWKQQYINNLCTAFPTGEHENWAQCRTLYPHARLALSQPPKSEESLRQWALLLYRAAWYAWRQGSLSDAGKLSMRSMKVRTKLLGREHKDTLSSMVMVGLATALAGRWTETEELGVQVMETSLRVLGEEHPDTLTSMGNLASTYRNQGRWKEAEELGMQVVETSLRVLGEEHPDTLTSMGNLALTYGNQGRWKEAEELGVQVMETKKRVLGEEHPDMLTSMANLALTWKSQSQNDKAISLLEKCCKLQERILGPHYPHTETALQALNRWRMENLEINV